MRPDEVAPPLETWIERESRLAAESAARRADEFAKRERAGEAAISRMRAMGCDNGHGVCVYCAAPLGVDSTGAFTHADNGCPGMPRKCGECGTPWEWDGKRWNPMCNAQIHAARERDRVWTLATRERSPLALPPRVYKDD